MTPDPVLPATGDLVASKYRVLGRIGSGGMGVVFEGVNIGTDTPVAIKCLNPELVRAPWAVQRFQREAKVTGRIQHPNVIFLYDYGWHEGCPYLVMELLKGVSLRTYAAGRRLTPEDACRIMFPVMRGVAAAHAVGVLHRDLKPDNIFLQQSPDGLEPVPKVLDFGLAKLDGSRNDMPALSAIGAVLGTYHFMAPEQLRPQGELDVRVDVYALGAILYGLLTGRLPYEAENPIDLALQVLEAEPALVTEHVASLSPELASVVARALCRDREQRYPTVDAFADGLKPFAPALSYRGSARPALPPQAFPDAALSFQARPSTAVESQQFTPLAPSVGGLSAARPPRSKASTPPPSAVRDSRSITDEFNAKTFQARLRMEAATRTSGRRWLLGAGSMVAGFALVMGVGSLLGRTPGSTSVHEHAPAAGAPKAARSWAEPPPLPALAPAPNASPAQPSPDRPLDPSAAAQPDSDWLGAEELAPEPSMPPEPAAPASPKPILPGDASPAARGKNARQPVRAESARPGQVPGQGPAQAGESATVGRARTLLREDDF